MPTETHDRDSSTSTKPKQAGFYDWLLMISGIAAIWLMLTGEPSGSWWRFWQDDPVGNYTPAPLVMQGGDPYIRALMRTISASEASDPRPYSLLYGGGHIQDFSHHPDRCIPILSGPNVGKCTTAAGRYQFITTTWLEKAHYYHPHPDRVLFWESYSFAPKYQDEVVYAWLNDPQAWGANLSQMLRAGKVSEVLQLLSSTWTSLNGGIEPNMVTDQLTTIYQQMLQEELQQVGP
jgi:muramidase (phage lysozyme)